MGFPITAGGIEFARSDFEENDYKDNLGPFLAGLMVDKCVEFRANSADYVTDPFSPVTLTLDRQLAFIPGQMIVLMTESGEFETPYWLVGIVTDVDPGNPSTVTFNVIHYHMIVAANNWRIYLAQGMSDTSLPLSTANGGTGATTEDTALTAIGFALPAVSGAEIFEDFCGLKQSVTSTASTNASQSMYGTYCTGAATINPEFHKLEKASVLPDLHQHPGICELTVKNPGDAAGIFMCQSGTHAYAAHAETKLSFSIFIPYYPDSSADEWTFRLGWLRQAVIDAEGSAEGIIATGNDQIGTSVGNSTEIGNRNLLLFDDYADGTIQTEIGDGPVLPLGRWLKVVVITTAENEVQVKMTADDGTFTEWHTFVTTLGTDVDQSGTPMVRIYKKNGTQARSMYVDYIHCMSLNNINR